MTIAIGFKLRDSIILGTDKQMTATGYHKYYQDKIWIQLGKNSLVALAYAGVPEQMRLLLDIVRNELGSDNLTGAAVLKVLSDGVAHIGRQVKKNFLLETLCAVSTPEDLYLYRTNGNLAFRADLVNFCGIGDSSVIRFIESLAVIDSTSQDKAAAVASYIIRQANRFIDGCSGGPEVIIINKAGVVRPADPTPRLEGIQHSLSKALFGFMGEDDIDGLNEKIREFRKL